MTNREPIWSYPLHPLTDFGIMAKEQSSCRTKTKKTLNIWLMMPHALCKTMPSSPSPWLLMTTKVFSPLMSSVPSSLFTAGKKFNLASNQTKQVKPCLCGLAWRSTFRLFALPNEGWKSQMCWMSFKIWKHNEGRPQSYERKFREYIMTHGWWWYGFSLMGWLISAVTSTPGCFFRNHREEEHCGNNTHAEPINSQMCLSKWILSHRKEGFPQWLKSRINEVGHLKTTWTAAKWRLQIWS